MKSSTRWRAGFLPSPRCLADRRTSAHPLIVFRSISHLLRSKTASILGHSKSPTRQSGRSRTLRASSCSCERLSGSGCGATNRGTRRPRRPRTIRLGEHGATVRRIPQVTRPAGRKAGHPAVTLQAPPAEHSPYWMGLRISVVIPTYSRSASLLRTLRALEQQSILPQEFEVIVVDDDRLRNSRDARIGAVPVRPQVLLSGQSGTWNSQKRRYSTRRRSDSPLHRGQYLADRRLLEEHLHALAQRGAPGAAVLGHIDGLHRCDDTRSWTSCLANQASSLPTRSSPS